MRVFDTTTGTPIAMNSMIFVLNASLPNESLRFGTTPRSMVAIGLGHLFQRNRPSHGHLVLQVLLLYHLLQYHLGSGPSPIMSNLSLGASSCSSAMALIARSTPWCQLSVPG